MTSRWSTNDATRLAKAWFSSSAPADCGLALEHSSCRYIDRSKTCPTACPSVRAKRLKLLTTDQLILTGPQAAHEVACMLVNSSNHSAFTFYCTRQKDSLVNSATTAYKRPCPRHACPHEPRTGTAAQPQPPSQLQLRKSKMDARQKRRRQA